MELVLAAPILIVLLLLVVGAGRYAHVRGQVDAAAAEGARAASLARDANTAASTGDRAVRAQLGDTCRALDVAVDAARAAPGETVTTRVTCTISLSSLGLAGFPGDRTFTATGRSPIDNFRSR